MNKFISLTVFRIDPIFCKYGLCGEHLLRRNLSTNDELLNFDRLIWSEQ
ncbi:hypothetical protein M153_11600012811 [Pseudoloma neurophilia]|uniref:Uncharacterized protein n=1 Tax=Pseudoloma neurophilia TaxID=146866 RepID=A0A0R0M014_9MICR|nr:hypothetical protein M153_11600012811 [Pseudoloma neurophilia]